MKINENALGLKCQTQYNTQLYILIEKQTKRYSSVSAFKYGNLRW